MVIFFFFFQSACSDLRRPSSIIRRPFSLAKDPIIAPYSSSKCTVPDSISSYQSGRCQLLLIIAPAYSAASALPNPTRSLILQRRSPGFPLLFRPQRLRQRVSDTPTLPERHSPTRQLTLTLALIFSHALSPSHPLTHAHAVPLKEHITTTPRHLHSQGESPTGRTHQKRSQEVVHFLPTRPAAAAPPVLEGQFPARPCQSLPVPAESLALAAANWDDRPKPPVGVNSRRDSCSLDCEQRLAGFCGQTISAFGSSLTQSRRQSRVTGAPAFGKPSRTKGLACPDFAHLAAWSKFCSVSTYLSKSSQKSSDKLPPSPIQLASFFFSSPPYHFSHFSC